MKIIYIILRFIGGLGIIVGVAVTGLSFLVRDFADNRLE